MSLENLSIDSRILKLVVHKEPKMKKVLVNFIVCSLILTGCSSVKYQTSDRCINYTVTGDKVEWLPIKYYQDQTDLYMELPISTKFTPQLFVVDTEFNEPSTIPYSYNPETHTLRIQDNYDEYLLTRKDVLGISRDKVYIKCNRSVPITPQVEVNKDVNDVD